MGNGVSIGRCVSPNILMYGRSAKDKNISKRVVRQLADLPGEPFGFWHEPIGIMVAVSMLSLIS